MLFLTSVFAMGDESLAGYHGDNLRDLVDSTAIVCSWVENGLLTRYPLGVEDHYACRYLVDHVMEHNLPAA